MNKLFQTNLSFFFYNTSPPCDFVAPLNSDLRPEYSCLQYRNQDVLLTLG